LLDIKNALEGKPCKKKKNKKAGVFLRKTCRYEKRAGVRTRRVQTAPKYLREGKTWSGTFEYVGKGS